MAKVYFYKELVSNPFIARGGPVPFETLDGNRGVIQLDSEANADLVMALEEAAAKRRGGVRKISEEDYNEKKNLPTSPSLKNRSIRNDDKLRILPAQPNPFQAAKAADGKPAQELMSNGMPLYDANGKRMDGPTLQEYIEAGYKKENYPPIGYAPRDTPASGKAAAPMAPGPTFSAPDDTTKKLQTPGPEKPVEIEPVLPTFKPATKKMGEEKAKKEKVEKKPEPPAAPPEPPEQKAAA